MTPASPAAQLRDLLDLARQRQETDLLAARSMAQQARVLARTTKDERSEAEALYRLASIAFSEGAKDQAFALALDAGNMARTSGNTVVEVFALSIIGIVHLDSGNYEQALASALKAVELNRTTDRDEDEGLLLNTVAAIQQEIGDLDRALVTYEAALMANKRVGQPQNDAITLANMSEIRAERGENLLAVTLSEEALELARVHDPQSVPGILAKLAESYSTLECHDLADTCLVEARELLGFVDGQPTEASWPALVVEKAQGRVDTNAKRFDTAIVRFRSALAIAQELPAPKDELYLHGQLATLFKAQGRFEEALTHQEARFARHEDLFNHGTDLRLRTLQIAHDTEATRQQAEILRLRTSELEAMVRGRTSDLEEYHLEVFQRIAVVGECLDGDHGEHASRVGDLAADIGDELGEPLAWTRQLRLAARLHDIGKIAVPDSILLKPGPLSPDEFQTMTRHTTIGAQLLAGGASSLMQLAATVTEHHHERWDGAGYPAGLAGGAIPLGARIVAVADVFDALTMTSPYKHAWNTLDAIHYVHGGSGRQFDPRIVGAFVRVMASRHPELMADLVALMV